MYKIAKSIIFITFLTLLCSCNKEKKNLNFNCKHTNCTVLGSDNLELKINSEIIFVEHLYTFKISSELPIKEVVIEGITMSMGKIPLMINNLNNAKHQYIGEFLLGMCSEPNMKWQFVITFENDQKVLLPFHSYWPK